MNKPDDDKRGSHETTAKCSNGIWGSIYCILVKKANNLIETGFSVHCKKRKKELVLTLKKKVDLKF